MTTENNPPGFIDTARALRMTTFGRQTLYFSLSRLALVSENAAGQPYNE